MSDGGFPGFGTLATPKALKFEDVHPGSVITVHDRRNPAATEFTATVLETRPEYGPTNVPALVLRKEGDDDISIITSNGNWVIAVVADSKLLHREPEDVVTFVPKQRQRHGVQYTGGLENAEKIIRWASGSAVISFHAGQAGDSEHLTVQTLEGAMRADVGDWIMRGLKGEFYPIKREPLEAGYDVVHDDAEG